MVNLRRMRHLIDRIVPAAEFRVERAMSKATKCTSVLTGMPRSGGTGSAMDNSMELLETVRGEYDRVSTELKMMQDALAPMIDRLENPNERLAADLRYIKAYHPATVASCICLSDRHTFRILERAEKKLEEMMTDADSRITV